MVAAASGIALFLFMFFDWFGIKDVPGGASAWESFSFIDILLFLAAAVAVGMALARAAGAMPANLPAPPGQIVAGAGALAVLLILFRLIVTPDFNADAFGVDVDTTRKIGAFLGLFAAGGIAFGGYTALNERASGAAPGASTSPPPPSPPPAAPPASESPSSPPPSEPPASGPPA